MKFVFQMNIAVLLISSTVSQPPNWPLLTKLPKGIEQGSLRGAVADDLLWTPASSAEGEQITDPSIGGKFLKEIEDRLGRGDLLVANEGYFADLAQTLRPMFDALEKNEYGNLHHTGVRYALHRLFVARHGWVIKGLDSAGQHFNSSSPVLVFNGKIPQKVQGMFEKRLGGKGFGIKDLVAFASLLEQLISQETQSRLFALFDKFEIPPDRTLDFEEMELIVDLYTSSFILGFDVDSFAKLSQSDLLVTKDQMPDLYVAWKDLREFVRKVRIEVLGERTSFSLPDIGLVMIKFGERFGKWQNFECVNQKRKLMDLEGKEKGCVPIANFYKPILSSNGQDWHFAESPEYLMSLGAVDSRDPSNMQVMVPNYLNSPGNCIAASQFYLICCIDECEALVGHIEQQVRGPIAYPRDLARIVSKLPSSTESANRSLTPLELHRLESIAEKHGGQVPIHGRLFMQWMHNAYPRECAYPHRSGTTTPLTSEQWFNATGEDANASMEAIRSVSSKASPTSSTDGQCGRWQDEEELFVTMYTSRRSLRDLETDAHTWAATTSVALLCAVASLALALISVLKSLKTTLSHSGKHVHSLMVI